MKERISYYSDGLKLSGILSTPDNSQGKKLSWCRACARFHEHGGCFLSWVR